MSYTLFMDQLQWEKESFDDEELSDRTSVQINALVQKVDQKLFIRSTLTISALANKFTLGYIYFTTPPKPNSHSTWPNPKNKPISLHFENNLFLEW